jgi:hypothetical protein
MTASLCAHLAYRGAPRNNDARVWLLYLAVQQLPGQFIEANYSTSSRSTEAKKVVRQLLQVECKVHSAKHNHEYITKAVSEKLWPIRPDARATP